LRNTHAREYVPIYLILPHPSPLRSAERKRVRMRNKCVCIKLKTTLLTIVRILNHLAIFAIRIYQNTLGLMFPPSCRFYPSCSEYAIEAFKKFGLVKAGWLSVKRLSKCHHFNPGGFDPLP